MTKPPNGSAWGLQLAGQVLSYQPFSLGLRLSRSPAPAARECLAGLMPTSKCHPAGLNWLRYCWP